MTEGSRGFLALRSGQSEDRRWLPLFGCGFLLSLVSSLLAALWCAFGEKKPNFDALKEEAHNRQGPGEGQELALEHLRLRWVNEKCQFLRVLFWDEDADVMVAAFECPQGMLASELTGFIVDTLAKRGWAHKTFTPGPGLVIAWGECGCYGRASEWVFGYHEDDSRLLAVKGEVSCGGRLPRRPQFYEDVLGKVLVYLYAPTVSSRGNGDQAALSGFK